MKQKNYKDLTDATMWRWLSITWLWIGVIGFLFFTEFEIKEFFPIGSVPLDCVFVASILAVVTVAFIGRHDPPALRANSLLGTIHACAMILLTMGAIALAKVLFWAATGWVTPEMHAQMIWMQNFPLYGSMQHILCSLGRGVGFYYIASAIIFLKFRKIKNVSLPPFGTPFLFSMFLLFVVNYGSRALSQHGCSE